MFSQLFFSFHGTLKVDLLPKIETNICQKTEVEAVYTLRSVQSDLVNDSMNLWQLNVLICKMGPYVSTDFPGNIITLAVDVALLCLILDFLFHWLELFMWVDEQGN